MDNKLGGNGRNHLTEATGLVQGPSSAGQELALETVQHILAQRAARLARAPSQEEKGDRTRMVVVRLGRELYALDTQFVFDIWPMHQVTFVPRVPKWVLGVVNRRGRILSVVDLREFLGLAEADIDSGPDSSGWDGGTVAETAFLILVQVPEMELVFCVDDVLGVEALLDSRIQETAGTVRGIPSEYVQGVSELDNERIKALATILDLSALLTDERLIVHQEVV